MKVIIAGSRSITDYDAVKRAVADSGFVPTEIVSGHQRGVDTLGERWSEEFLGRPAKLFPADWGRYGNYAAGRIRNGQMAAYAQALVLVCDGQSPGSNDMLKAAERHGLKVHMVTIK